MNISFIGFGSMARAIARGLLQQNTHHLSAAAPSLSVGRTSEQIHTHYDNKEVIQHADIIILAVKPNQMAKVLHELTPELPASCLLVSVAAGLSLDWFSQRFNKPFALIRTMPNTPASVGLGATPMIANAYATSEQRHWAEHIFSTVGIVHWVSQEEELDTFTALSGSGPAYVYLFVETLINAAVALGLEPGVAKQFALQTCKGALALAENSPLALSELRNQVTSPGGTTAAGLNVLHQQLDTLIQKALQAAKTRAHELGQMS
jgi:pyrroline-5-carboxylate reductase